MKISLPLLGFILLLAFIMSHKYDYYERKKLTKEQEIAAIDVADKKTRQIIKQQKPQ